MLKSQCETRMESGGTLAFHDLGEGLTREEGVLDGSQGGPEVK